MTIELISPQNKFSTDGFDYRFEWEEADGALNYQVIIAREREFKNPVVNTMVIEKSDFLCPLLLDKGTYYWKVRAQYKDFSLSKWSSVFSFELVSPPADDQYSTGHLMCYMKA